MDMAPRRRRRRGLLRSKRSVLVSVSDHDVGYLVYRFDVKRLYDDDDGESKSRRSRRREVLPLPRKHVACFPRPLGFSIDLAASPRGDKMVAATDDGHMMVYDATRSRSRSQQHTAYDHDLAGSWKRCPIILALSSSRRRSSRNDDAMSMLVGTGVPDLSNPDDEPFFEALRLTSGGRLQPLPVPPPLVSPPLPARWRGYGNSSQVTSHFVAGGRAWLSVGGEAGDGRGTYSYSLLAPNKPKLGCCWRREGSWVLPLDGRAVYAPDLAGGLLLGLSHDLKALCAIDMEARPPVIRQHWQWWPTLFPTEDEGYSEDQDYLCFDYGGLAYLGGGRLCISWSSPYRSNGERMMLALTAVELTLTNDGDLLLRKRRSRCYRLPPGNQKATVLPVI